MQTISLFQPGKINLNVSIPSDWNELTREELLMISKQLITAYKEPHECTVRILAALIQMRSSLRGAPKGPRSNLPNDWALSLNPDDVANACTDAMQWIFALNNLTKQHNPVLLPFRGWGLNGRRPLHGPAEDFNSITCGEFEDAEIFFIRFRQEKKEEWLHLLNAILWRPKNTVYKGYNVDAAKKHIKKIPAHVLYANYLWYTGCRNQLPKMFPNLFGGGAPVDDPDLIAFTRCIHAGAGPENGTRENIRTMLLKEFCLDLEMRIKRNKENEQELLNKNRV